MKQLFCGYGNGQPLAAPCAPSLDDKPAVFGGHPYKETMSPFT